MKALTDYVIVEIEREFNDEIEVGGKTLILGVKSNLEAKGTDEINYNPNDYKRFYGTVIDTPKALTKGFLPIYFDECPREMSVEAQTNYEFNHLYADSIPLEVKQGDKCYFIPTENIRESWFKKDGKIYLKVQYENIICVVRDTIIPIGSWTFIEPKEKKHSSILWTPKVEEKTYTGKVLFIGSPLIGLEKVCEVNDIVTFASKYALELEVENKKYYLIRQHLIEYSYV